MFLSIIIPVYKVERYVRHTLDSIFSQDFSEDDFEVIAVDDGSPDKSVGVVEEFAMSHANLHIIRQGNMGLSCARNTGLAAAKGDYVWFVDSDDTVAAGSLERLRRIAAENPDIDMFGFNMVCIDEATGAETVQRIVPKRRHDYLYGRTSGPRQLVGRFVKTPVQRFLFKREFLTNNNLSFYPGIYHEDEEFVPRAVFLANGVRLVDYASYRYLVRNSGSIMASRNAKKIGDQVKILNSLTAFSRAHSMCYADTAFFDFCNFMMVIGILSDKKNVNEDARRIVKSNMPHLRRLAVRGVLASAYSGLWRQVLKGLPIMLFPSLASSVVELCRKLKGESVRL